MNADENSYESNDKDKYADLGKGFDSKSDQSDFINYSMKLGQHGSITHHANPQTLKHTLSMISAANIKPN